MKNVIFGSIAVIAALAIVWFVFVRNTDTSETAHSSSNINSDTSTAPGDSVPSPLLTRAYSDVDLTQSIVNFDLVLSGGVSKDGIPALSDPKFDPLSASNAPGDTQGILIEHEGVKKYYPYNILVSHEIVNDSIGDLEFAVTFCPLCGSAIVFNSVVDGESKDFGVSGFLFESNLIMYDRTDTPSLWSQARGEAIIGDEVGTKLDIIDFQLLTLDDVKTNHSDAQILSTDTGYGRSYSGSPYVGYEDSADTIFPVSVDDARFPSKEVFFIVPLEQEANSVAIRISELDRGQKADSAQHGLSIEKTDGGELIVTDTSGDEKVGYYEMWFSWAQHHQENGQVWDLSEI